MPKATSSKLRPDPPRVDLPLTEARDRLRRHFADESQSEPSFNSAAHGRRWDSLWDDGTFLPWDKGFPNPALLDCLLQRADLVGTATAWPRSSGDSYRQQSRRRQRTALIPGCGRGYDVFLLKALGWDVVGLDISEIAIKRAEELGERCDGGEETWYEELKRIGPGTVATKSDNAVSDDRGQGDQGKARFVVGEFFEPDKWLHKLGFEPGPDGGFHGVFDLIYDYTFLSALPVQTRPEWASTMAKLLVPNGGRLVCLEFPTDKPPSAGGPPWALPPDVYVAHLASPGQRIEYDEDGKVKDEQGHFKISAVGDSHTLKPGSLERLDHWKPERTHEVGKGKDWMSIWSHIA